MIIDLILDRKDALENDVKSYNAHDFYMECMSYNSTFYGIADGITRAMDGGTEEEVKAELCNYILKNGYNTEICEFIQSVNWLYNTEVLKMFIDILRSAENSAKVIKEVITYKADGNGIKTVKKELLSLAEVYHDNSINGLFADVTEPENNGIIIYKDLDPCIEVSTIYNDPTAEQMRKALQNYNGKMGTFSDYENMIKNAIAKSRYIKNDVLYLLKVHGCTETLQKALEVKESIKEKQMQEEAEKYAKFEAEQRKQEEEAERKKSEKIAFLCGYADGKTQIQTERIYNVLSKIQGYRNNQNGGKIEYKSRRDFIIDTLTEGGKAEQKDGIVSYYGSKWDRKQSKPKTEYRLYTAEGSYYTITKIEYDFACFMMQKTA